MSSSAVRPSSLAFSDSGRQSPFRRQNSTASSATARATTPTTSPTKGASHLSPTKNGSLSPEKASPFVRRPSVMSQASDRPSSPFARPSSSLGLPASPSRQASNASSRYSAEVNTPPQSPAQRPSPPTAGLQQDARGPSSPVTAASPSPFDGNASEDDPIELQLPKQASLRPAAPRTVTSSTVSTIKAPIFNPSPSASISAPATKPSTSAPLRHFPAAQSGNGSYSHIPQPLLRSMRESFEVLDSTNTGALTPAILTSTLSQLGLDTHPTTLATFFPSSSTTQLNLARYLDTLSAPLASLSSPDELSAAFEAFDVDDSGQVDVTELRRALLETAPEPGDGGARLSEGEVDAVLGEFAGRRAFGAKGLHAGKGKGEVFRYREFMAGVWGGGGGGEAGVEGADGVGVGA